MTTKAESKAGERTHPLEIGTIVDVRNRSHSGKQIIEGRATIVSAKGGAPNYYNVRFHTDGHNMTYPRFVMPEHQVTESNSMLATQNKSAGERTQGSTNYYGFLNDLSGCSFHWGENMRDLTIRSNDGGKIGLPFSDKIAALRIDREQSPEAIAAAPELLTAAKKALWLLDTEGGLHESDQHNVCVMLLAAIAKAEGRV